MPFNLALSGMNAAMADLNVTANNIANASTSGFKSSRAEFADLFAVSSFGVAKTAIGNGVKVSAVTQQFTQGNIDFTDNNLDLAVSGEGFFTLSDQGALAYTRSGAFHVDNSGYVINNAGMRLQVYPPLPAGGFNTGGLADLQLIVGDSAPRATTAVELLFNLPANASPPASTTFDPTDPTSYNNATSITIYDSLGAAHTASYYFTRSANANEWSARLYVDGTAVGGPQPLEFSDTGALVTPAGGELSFPAYPPATGAAPISLTVDVSRATQYGSQFTVNSVSQDGFTTGRLTGIDVDSTGVVSARYTNGRSLALGQVAMTNFANTQGLQQLGDTTWSETFTSGPAQRGLAGNSGFGLVQSGALEASNVDLTAQLVNMITAQRNFQANAQMISTADQITQTVINIR
ncbi:MAG: flagellar hook protein FlgE [Steroidobacteraceae bacterium]|nr:flagellar hook protein FlgE [Steroidobacteraceae bacterium]